MSTISFEGYHNREGGPIPYGQVDINYALQILRSMVPGRGGLIVF